MIWIIAYFAIGAVLFWITVSKDSKDPDDYFLPLVLFAEPIAWIFWLYWPVALWALKEDLKSRIVRKVTGRYLEGSMDPLIGQIGPAITPMLPSGRVRLGEKDYEATSLYCSIERGETVKVLAISMGTLKVEKLQQDTGSDNADKSRASP